MMAFKELLDKAGELRPRRWPEAWFQEIARSLLNECLLMVAGVAHRVIEVEFYYCDAAHPDPFVHCDARQRTAGRWYFHRVSGGYRGGSFKGLDITFGPSTSYGGVLIRSLETPEGEVINGCSLCVDHLLVVTGCGEVGELDALVGPCRVDDPRSAVHLVCEASIPRRAMWATARVGLSLKRAARAVGMPAYIMRRYRFVTRPRAIKKGRVHGVIAMHQDGHDVESIHRLLGTPRKTIERYLRAYDQGASLENLAVFHGRALNNGEVARLHGAWSKIFRALRDERCRPSMRRLR